jgi:hypothetical protein
MKYKKVFFGCKEKGKVVEGPPQLAPRAVVFKKIKCDSLFQKTVPPPKRSGCVLVERKMK